jgi:DNA processing protein
MNRGLLLENERAAWIFLNQIPGLEPSHFHRLLQAARSAGAILELPVSGLLAADVQRDLAEKWHRSFRDPQNQRSLDAELKRLSQGVCQAVTELDEGYPCSLRELLDRPPVLYYKGRWPPPSEGVVGLVGTRHPSPYGTSVAERLATDLSIQGIATVSGLAQGIDTAVHRATLEAGGHTIAIQGCGLGRVFPADNAALQARIAEAGTLISEFSYEIEPESRHFPRRNRIISGLSQGVVVIEAASRSGATITARCAAEQGRDVFAVPGRILESTSAGCHRLIRDGARLVESAGDILEELGIIREPSKPAAAVKKAVSFDTLSALEKQIVEIVTDSARSADEITQKTSCRFEQVANSLLSLELKGYIRALPGQRYGKT